MSYLFDKYYDFTRMSKEEIFLAWETFLREEKTRKYSPYADLDPDMGKFISNFKTFKGFVEILGGHIGSKRTLAKEFGISEETFGSWYGDEFTVFEESPYGEATIIETELAAIFRIQKLNNNCNWCTIVRNFPPEEANQLAISNSKDI